MRRFVRLLLDKGADINATDRHDHAALHCAAAMERKAVVRLLLCREADTLDASVFRDKALNRARFYQHTNIAITSSRDLDATARYKDHKTVLHIAAEHTNYDVAATVIKSLLDKGVRMTEDWGGYYSNTPIYLAIRQGNEKVVRLLIEAGAWRAYQSSIDSIINGAILCAHYEIARYLIKTVPAGFTDGTLLYRVINLLSADTTLIAHLLVNVVPTGHSHSRPHTLLYAAIRRGQSDSVVLLLQHGVDINFRNNGGETSPIFATVGGAWPHGVYVEQWNRGKCDVMLRIAGMLLATGAEINAQDKGGQTALHHAVIAGGEAMALSLLKAGADIAIRDSVWRSLVEVAMAGALRGLEESAIFELLLEKAGGMGEGHDGKVDHA